MSKTPEKRGEGKEMVERKRVYVGVCVRVLPNSEKGRRFQGSGPKRRNGSRE